MISQKVDIWSVGIITYFLLYGSKPFPMEKNIKDYLYKILNRQIRLTFPDDVPVSDKTKIFISKCLEYNPAYRPDVL